MTHKGLINTYLVAVGNFISITGSYEGDTRQRRCRGGGAVRWRDNEWKLFIDFRQSLVSQRGDTSFLVFEQETTFRYFRSATTTVVVVAMMTMLHRCFTRTENLFIRVLPAMITLSRPTNRFNTERGTSIHFVARRIEAGRSEVQSAGNTA